MKEAIATFERGVAVTQGEHCFEIALLGSAFAAAGETVRARELLDGLTQRATREYVPPYDLALLHCALGEKDAALSALEKAYDERNALVTFRIHLPNFAPLREEPRWRTLADKLGRTYPIKTYTRARER